MCYAEGLRQRHAGPELLMISVTQDTAAAGQSFPRYTQTVYIAGMPQQPYTRIHYHQGAEPNGTMHLHVPMVDEANAPGREVCAAVRKCVDRAIEHWSDCKGKGTEGKVLLYCAEGQNRSAAVGLAALLAHGVGLEEAMRRLTAADTEYWTKFVGPGGERLKNIVTQALAPEPKYYYKVHENPSETDSYYASPYEHDEWLENMRNEGLMGEYDEIEQITREQYEQARNKPAPAAAPGEGDGKQTTKRARKE